MFADSAAAAAADWSTSSFAWSQGTRRMEEDKLELNWDDDVGESEDADSPPMSMKLDKKEEEDVHKSSENDSSKNYSFFFF